MHLTNFPRFVPISSYDCVIQRMVEILSQQEGVITIYRIGSISSPGISDIDILVVFEDGIKYNLNPLKCLSRTDRYLFVHGLYGISRKLLNKAHQYSLEYKYNLLWGEKLPVEKCDLSKEEIETLKTQIALEYLIKMFVNLTVEFTYGIVRVRGLLLHTKALLLDLEFLNISDGKLFDLLNKILLWRNHWFDERPDKLMLSTWIQEFYKELSEFLSEILRTKSLYLPERATLSLAKNMNLVPARNFGYINKGITLPAILGDLGKKYFNVQHRLNHFTFEVPISSSPIYSAIKDRFRLLREMKRYRDRYILHFSPLASSLNVF